MIQIFGKPILLGRAELEARDHTPGSLMLGPWVLSRMHLGSCVWFCVPQKGVLIALPKAGRNTVCIH